MFFHLSHPKAPAPASLIAWNSRGIAPLSTINQTLVNIGWVRLSHSCGAEIMAGLIRPMSLYRINGTPSHIIMKQIALFLVALVLTVTLATARADDTNAPVA